MTLRNRPSLQRAFDSPADKARYVRRLFGVIAGRYDLITRLLSFGFDQRWKRRLLSAARIRPGAHVLDLACGTGDLAFGAARAGGRAIGLDVTPAMIAHARRKPGALAIDWVVGDISALPVASASCAVVTIGYGLRNVPELPAALDEIVRVLEPGGTMCALDFDRPDSPFLRAVFLAYLECVGRALGWLLHRDPDTYGYIPASIRRYPGARGVAGLMRAAGFREVVHVPVFGGLMAIHVASK